MGEVMSDTIRFHHSSSLNHVSGLPEANMMGGQKAPSGKTVMHAIVSQSDVDQILGYLDLTKRGARKVQVIGSANIPSQERDASPATKRPARRMENGQ